jgi:hypothetical protein
MSVFLLVAATLLGQRLLSSPGMPPEAGLVVLPMVWIVGGALCERGHRFIYLALALGLGWDLMLEPVIGPGGIAWSATAVLLVILASFVADRSAKAWFLFGVAGTLALVAVRNVALTPLGVPVAWSWTSLGLGGLLTGVWCGFIGWVRALDVPQRWRVWRTRKLR